MTTRPPADADSGGPPRGVLIAALVVAVATVAGILVFAAARRTPQQPVVIPAAPAPQATSSACQALTAGLPPRLGDYQRTAVAPPVPDGASAWRSATDSEPIIVRCGLERPEDFVVGTPIQMVDRVQWFRATADAAQPGRSTWYTVDRAVYVALTLPAGSGPTPIQDLSSVIDRTMPAQPIDPGQAR